MRLSSVTMQGFKSFGHRTTVELSPSVTAIVGPNGSGKSNLLDALKWVTGGGRAREFRAENRTDLIFHGAEGKRGVSFAEVEVEIVDNKRVIKIRRDIDKSGTTRLRLDGRSARFLDIDEALAGSGLGTSGVAMIGQGEIAGVIMADPSTLLRYVAEAAGVARLSGRREQTQARLDTARSHLARLEDVLLELRERLEQLQGEAGAAEAHAQLQQQALSLRVTAGFARVTALEAEVAQLRAQEGAAEQAILEGREAIAQARTRLDNTRQQRMEMERLYREALAESERAQGVLALARAGLERANESRLQAEQAANVAHEEATILAGTPEPVDPNIDTGLLARNRDDADARAQTAVVNRERTEANLVIARETLAQAQANAAQHAANLSAYAATRASLESDAERLEIEFNNVQATAVQVDGGALEAKQQARDSARVALVELEAALSEARSSLEAAHANHATAHGAWVAAKKLEESTRQTFEARRGYGQGSKVALQSGIAGVLGSVADLVSVDPAYSAAIGGALGRRAEYVVVDTASTAQQVLEVVREAGGWVTLLPLDLLRANPESDTAPGPGFVAWAHALVRVESHMAVVVQQLLGNTAVVESMAQAREWAKRPGARPRLVTLEGDVIEATGAMSGGRRGAAASVLGLAADVERSERERASAEATEAAARQTLALAQAAVADAAAGAKAQRERNEVIEADYRALEAEVVRNRDRLQSLQAERERVAEALAQLQPPSEQDDPVAWLAAAQDAEGAAAGMVEQARLEADRAVAAFAEARRESEVGAERRLAFETAKLLYEQAQAKAAQRFEEAAAHRARAEEWTQEAVAAEARRAAAEAALPRDVGDKKAAFEAAESALAEADALIRSLTEAQAGAGEKLEEVRLALARREAALELALDEKAALPEGVELQDLSERVARAKLREVEAAIEALGPINQRAAIEHAAQSARLVELETEGAQAAEAVNTLERTLADIDAETNGRLNATLGDLTSRFGSQVQALFGDQAVGMVEVERDGERPIGVRIKLQPPGKRTEALALLSVGERTMGALAFLFALMAGEGGGLPIAVLDEVDAPLDEANIRRFTGFIETLAAGGTQFVLITHQKATFEVADTVWGVTSDGGVSRVFSIRREREVPLFDSVEPASSSV